MRRSLHIVIATVAAMVAACTADDTPHVRVVDRVTGAAIAGAVVLRRGADVLEIAAPGYLSMRVRADVHEDVRMFPAVTSAADDERLSERLAASVGTAVRRTVDDGDLRTEARALQAMVDARAGEPLAVGSAGPVVTPDTIRIWRRRLDGSTASCMGRVDIIPFDQYVKGVLPHEWIPSWHARALETGAIAIRTYAAAWVAAGGKYTCADLDDTAASQVYRDETLAKTDAAVDATADIFIVKDGAVVLAEYSAENSDPTATGVAEPYCTGRTLAGHGRGACQWGTQRWALNEGKDYVWMIPHYYPGTSLQVPPGRYSAARAADSYAATMTSGDEVVAWVDLMNTGTAAWDVATTQVATTSPRDRVSPFYKQGAWLSQSRPALVATDAAPGAVGRFEFVMKAPEVEVPTTFVEQFGLVQEGQTWFGPEENLVTWTITVNPKNAASPDAGPAPVDEPSNVSSSGCAVAPARTRRGDGYSLTRTAAMLLLAVAAWRRGRQLVIVGVGEG